MAGSVQGYPAETRVNGSVVTAVFRRAPLVMMTVIFTMISARYLLNPVGSAAQFSLTNALLFLALRS